MLKFSSKFISGYNSLLLKRPLATKIVTTFFICGSGDLACQMLEKKQSPWDKERTSRQAVVAGFTLSPILHTFLTRVMKPHVYLRPSPRIPASLFPFCNTAFKAAFHVFFFMPIMQTIFISSIDILKEKDFFKGIRVASVKIKPGIEWAMTYWPFLIFGLYSGFVPLRYGNLYMDVNNFIWVIVISNISN